LALLELRGVSKYFGSLAALDNVNLEVHQGELVGLVGPNGSGKTTLFNVITGIYRPTSGQIFYDGRNITGLRPDQIATRGLVRTFQSNIVFREATVLENVARACYLYARTNAWWAFFNTRAYRESERKIMQRAEELLEFWELGDVRNHVADGLSHGHQRRLGLAIAAAADPKLLLLDEPVSGMSGEEITVVMKHAQKLADMGITIVLVEHHVKTVVGFCQRLVALDYGRKIGDGKPKEVTAQKDVIAAYLGTEEVA